MAYDTVRYEQKITEIERENMKMKDTTFVIAVFDTLFTCDNLNLDVEYIGKQLVEPDYIEALNSMNNRLIQSYPLNLSEIENRKRFILKHSSEFPEGFKIWERENYNFLFSGILRMSRIYFNKEKLVGVFIVLMLVDGFVERRQLYVSARLMINGSLKKYIVRSIVIIRLQLCFILI